jgi:hypothetical protein
MVVSGSVGKCGTWQCSVVFRSRGVVAVGFYFDFMEEMPGLTGAVLGRSEIVRTKMEQHKLECLVLRPIIAETFWARVGAI